MSVVQGFNPRTGEPYGEGVEKTSDSEVDRLASLAASAFPEWSSLPHAQRAEVLDGLADALDAESELLVSVADAETALGEGRLKTELKRTTNQLRLFGEVLREGSYVEATLDSANPDIIPPRPVLRRVLRPLGPVAVFSASNFPFAFSVAGGDTASALASGCPVIVKAHSAHPRTSLETARVVLNALAAAGAPAGTFGIVYGTESGRTLVQHPAIKAAGFTGSTGGGRALFDLAQGRPDPIPFYGELGSVNPTVILPGAATPDIAGGFAASLTMGVGQFCTNPGLVFAPASIVDALGEAVAATSGGAMLNERMCDSYRASTDALAASDLVTVVSTGTKPDEAWAVEPRLFTVPVNVFRDNLEKLTEEHFGPAGIIVTYDDPAELVDVIRALPGTLTGTVHAAESDHEAAGVIAEALRHVAGRLIFNAWPTGVAVAWGQHHGGPWPSTTNPLHTSVGATSIRRWIAPVTYQSWPDALLPVELQEGNPLGIPRRVDGVLGVH